MDTPDCGQNHYYEQKSADHSCQGEMNYVGRAKLGWGQDVLICIFEAKDVDQLVFGRLLHCRVGYVERSENCRFIDWLLIEIDLDLSFKPDRLVNWHD